MNSTLIPIGVDCSISHYLRRQGKRLQAFPFDWNVTPLSSAISLIKNGFVDFMEEDNLIFLPPVNRMLFAENGIDLKVSKEIITPVVCKKYKILFPHDFSRKGKEELFLVKKKYERRICRLKSLLEQSEKVLLVYNLRNINHWQLDQYKSSGIEFTSDKLQDLYKDFEILRKLHPNIDLISLRALQFPMIPLDFMTKTLIKLRSRLIAK